MTRAATGIHQKRRRTDPNRELVPGGPIGRAKSDSRSRHRVRQLFRRRKARRRKARTHRWTDQVRRYSLEVFRRKVKRDASITDGVLVIAFVRVARVAEKE